MATFTMYKDQRGEYRWRLRANNHKIIADSAEGYTAKSDCREAIERVKKEAQGADTQEST